VKPYARDWDKDEKFPLEVVRELGQLGVMGMLVTEEYGGAAMDSLAVAVAVEEIARYDGSLALTVASHNGLGTSHLRVFGTEAQRKKYLPKLATGEYLGAWGLTEPGSGSDASSMKTSAVRKGSNWVLNGTKMFITQGTVGDVFVVLALTSPQKRQKGITAFLLEKGMPGFSQRSIHGKLGMRSSDTAELILENVEVPDSYRVGEVDHGFIDTMKILDKGRITIGALAVGLGRGALEVHPLLARAHRVRSAHQRVPGPALDDGGHEDGARRGPAAGAPRGEAGGRGQAVLEGGLHGEALRVRGGHARLQQGGADPRWLRLHPRVPRRALPARRQAL
jgi:alkylation response protein AidB-like acyl-CoA dehydrogenase